MLSASSSDINPVSPKWNWLQALAVGFLAVVDMDVLLSLVVGVGLGLYAQVVNLSEANMSSLTDSIFFNFIFYGSSRLLGLWLIFRFIKRRGGGWSALGFRGFEIPKAIGMVAAASLGLIVASSVIFYVLGQAVPTLDLEKEQEIVFSAANSTPEIAMAFVVLVILAPIVEEVIFRGFMLPAFAQRFGFIAATLITSLLFGLVHWQLNVGIITFIMGLFLAWIYAKTKSLGPPIIFHGLKNLVAFLLIF